MNSGKADSKKTLKIGSAQIAARNSGLRDGLRNLSVCFHFLCWGGEAKSDAAEELVGTVMVWT